jgi:hypothetical protein
VDVSKNHVKKITWKQMGHMVKCQFKWLVRKLINIIILKILHKEGKWIKVVPKGLIIVKLVVGSSNPNLTPLSFFVIEDNEPPLWLGVRGLSLELPKLNKKILYKKRKGFPSPCMLMRKRCRASICCQSFSQLR